MKFKCSKPETWGEYKARIAEWHRIFAWLPHRVEDGTCRWLEPVERRIHIKVWTYDIDKVKEYRAIK